MYQNEVIQFLDATKNEIAQLFNTSVEKIAEFYPIIRQQAIIYEITNFINIVSFATLAISFFILMGLFFRIYITNDDEQHMKQRFHTLSNIIFIILIISLVCLIASFIIQVIFTFEWKMILKLVFKQDI